MLYLVFSNFFGAGKDANKRRRNAASLDATTLVNYRNKAVAGAKAIEAGKVLCVLSHRHVDRLFPELRGSGKVAY